MKFRNPFRASPLIGPVRDAYEAIVLQAREPWFYSHLGVPDTPDSRFEMVAFHAYMVMRRLRDEGKAASEFSQKLFDLMFMDLDENLREMGVGDLAVGKRIRKLAEGFFGRVARYDEALDAEDDVALADAIARNIYRGVPGPRDDVIALAAYARRSIAALDATALDIVTNGQPRFAAAADHPDRKAATS